MCKHRGTMKKYESIFNNKMPEKVVKKAKRNAEKLKKKFSDDSNKTYYLKENSEGVLYDSLGIKKLEVGDSPWEVESKNPIIIGNIRMGFGHYRISMAIASCAKHMGYTPYWYDLSSYEQTTGGKIITHLNKLYSMGSRWSQKYSLFNHLYWEPLNSKGFKKLSYNASDLKMAELMTPIYQDLDKSIPFIATHVWPAQAAVEAKMQRVINVIPDNWPMGLHLSEGSIHTVQTYSSYFGYKTLKKMMGNQINNPMEKSDLVYTGHYIDHELVENLPSDTAKRLQRIQENKAKRVLMTIGGAGAQSDFYSDMILELLPKVKNNEVVLFINVGDHKHVYQDIIKKIPSLNDSATLYVDQWQQSQEIAKKALNEEVSGIHVFYHQDIYAAVYSTNLLLRTSDILITKPSELAFYPIPKLFIKRVGGHEMWGAIHSAEIGDGTIECETPQLANQMLELLLNEDYHLTMLNQAILNNYDNKVYHGGYKVVELASNNK